MDSVRPPQSARPPLPKPFPPKAPASIPHKPTPSTLKTPAPTTPLYTRPVSRFSWKKPLRYLLILLGLIFLGLLLFMGISFAKTLNAIQLKNEESPSFISQVGALTKSFGEDPAQGLRKTDAGRINVLLLGRAGENYPGKNLTDTIMMMSIDTEKHKVALISLPRDLYVTLPEEHVAGKINSFYQYGLLQNQGTKAIEQAVTLVTGEPLHYIVILDFDGFEKIIDTFGGIELEVARDIYDARYPGKNYSYETFELKKGWQKLDGKTALKYVRERHDDPEGDFGRAKRQQQVLTALKKKVFANSLFSNINAVNELLVILGSSIKTNATLPEMENFLRLAKRVDSENIENTVIDAWKKESLLRVSHVELGGVRAFTLVPRTGNWQEIREVSQDIFSHEQNEKRKAALTKENASLSLLYRPEDQNQARYILQILEETFPGKITLVPITRYTSWPEKSLALDQTNLTAPWTLDTVLKKLSLEKTATLPFSASQAESDIIVVLGKDTQSLFPDNLSFQADTDFDTKEGDPLIIEHTDTKL